MDNTIFPVQTKITNQKPFQLEFKQIKEYYNFQRKFKSDKDNSIKNQNPSPQKYYLIDKNWLNQWKEFVGFKKFCKMVSKREVTDNDYNIFIECLPKDKKENKLSPLDNSKVYNNGEINPLAEFMIINKESYDAFNETRKNTAYYMNEKSIFLKFLHDRIIMTINTNLRIIFFNNEQLKCEDELIIIFIDGNANKIISELENPNETFKYWLKNLDSYDYDVTDEKEFDRDNCKFKIVNKRLKNRSFSSFHNAIKPTIVSASTIAAFKYNLPGFLEGKLQTKVQEIMKNTVTLGNLGKNNKIINRNNIAQNPQFNNNFNNNNNNQFQFNNNNQFNRGNVNNMPMNSMNNMQMNKMNMQMNNMNMQMNNMNNMQMNIVNNIPMNNVNNFGLMSNMNIFNNVNNMISQNNNMNPISCQNFNRNNMQINFNNHNNMNNQEMNPDSRINQQNSQFTMGIIYPHPVGLLNVGQSCYMNATIECLSNIRRLSNILLKNYGKYDIKTQPLVVSYSSLIYELLHEKEKPIKPQLFKEIIGSLNPLFEGNHAADSKDLIFFLIETMHKELLPPSQNNNNNNVNFLEQEMNSRSEQIMFNEFIKEFQANRTDISNIFYGVNRSIMKCNICRVTKYSFQTFNLLIYPLKKIKEYKIGKVGKYHQLNLNLYDAFLCDQEVENLVDENMIYCDQCKKLTPGIHQQNIYSMPNILIIILNRGKNNQDFNEEFTFDEILDFTKGNVIINNPKSSKKFYLCGIVTHLGESGSSGHFIAYCRNGVNEPFLCYNDAAVAQVNVITAMETKLSKNEMKKKTPYILLYHCM